MLTTIDKLKFACASARKKTENFFYGYYYPVYIALFVLLFWVADLQVLGFAVVILTACFLLIFYDDFTPLLPLIFMAPMPFKDAAVAFSSIATLIPIIFLLALLVISLIYHFIKFPLTKLKTDNFTFVLIGLFIVLFLGGLFASYMKNFSYGVGVLLIAGLVPLSIHVLFLNKIKITHNFNSRKYFTFSFLTAVNLASMQLLYCVLYNKIHGHTYNIPGGFCWANSNHVANLILISVPLCLYLMRDCKHLILGAIELVFLYGAMIASKSDGALAVLLGFTPAMLIIFYLNAYLKHIKTLNVVYSIILCLGILVGSYLLLFKVDALLDAFQKASNPTGRLFAYDNAIRLFCKSPVFGVGLGSGSYELFHLVELGKSTEDYNGFFHSTFFHFLACCGIVGIIAYVGYYIARLKLIVKNDTIFGLFTLVAFLMFAVYGMIENSEYNIVLLYMTSIISFTGITNKKGNDDKPLPLLVKNILR